MNKKRLTGLFLTIFASASLLAFSNAEKHVALADSLVGSPSVTWNNIDFSGDFNQTWCPDRNENGVPQESYCLLVQYEANINTNLYFEQNMFELNVPNANFGDHILINGEKAEDVEGVSIYAYPYNGFFIRVPASSIDLTTGYEYLVIETLDGLKVDGTIAVSGDKFEYRGALGTSNHWLVNPAPVVKTQASLAQISWNNMDYSDGFNREWSGPKNENNSPENGYCVLLQFQEEGKTMNDTIIGDLVVEEPGLIGLGFNFDYKVSINGVNIEDVDGAVAYLYPFNGLFIYFPDSSLVFDDTYLFPVIEFEEGVHFNDVYLPSITLEFRGELGDTDAWKLKEERTDLPKFSFVRVAEDWNNISLDSLHNHTILQYGEPGIDYLKDNHLSDGTNLVTRFSDVGLKMSLNGKPLGLYKDILVSYIHGNCYVYMAFPIIDLQPSNGYKITTLHIKDETQFHDSLLGEVTLYLFNGKWTLEKPETTNDEDYENADTLQSVFAVNSVTLNTEKSKINGSSSASLDNFSFYADYKLDSSDSAFILFIKGKTEQDGIRLVVSGNTLSLYDTTNGNVLLGTATYGSFLEDDWFSLLVHVAPAKEGNGYFIYAAIDDVIYLSADNVLLDATKLGSNIAVFLGSGEVSFKEAVKGSDNKKPKLVYSGKEIYSVLTNSPVIDLSVSTVAIDAVDGDVSSDIECIWPEGAITEDKLNKGVWTVIISAGDKSGNVASTKVTVYVADSTDVTVTFDGQNPTTYSIGDHIAKVPNPTKEDTASSSYEFIGWYFNDMPWDFENDYIVCDMNLTSRFEPISTEYRVSFKVEGLKDVTSYDLYFSFGTNVNVSLFEKEGYTVKLLVNEEEVDSFIVDSNMTATLIYESTGKGQSKGCGGSLTSLILYTSIISGAALILLVSLRKKGGNKHE